MLKKIIQIFHPFRFEMAGVFFFIAVSQGVNLITPFLQGKLVDSLFGKHPTRDVYGIALLILGVWLFRILWGYLREVYELKFTDFRITHYINHETLTKLFGFSIGQHISENSGLKQSVINRGQHSLASMAYTVLYQVIPLFVQIVLLIGVLMYFDWVLGLIVLVGTCLYGVSVVYINTRFKDRFEKGERMQNDNSKQHGEVLRNIDLVLSNAQQDRATLECDESLLGVNSFWRDIWLGFTVFASLRNLLNTITRFCVILVGIHFVLIGKYSVGQFVMVLSWANQVLGEVGEIGSLHRQLIQMYTSVRRYFEMISIESDVKQPLNPVCPETILGNIEFRDVVFRYRKRSGSVSDPEDEEGSSDSLVSSEPVSPALDGVSFVIKAGQKVAVVGESGAGKSTLVYALIRAMDPESGSIMIDGIDIKLLDLTQLRHSVGIVEQQVFLFDNTLRYNILFGLNGSGKDVSEERLNKIAEMSCLDRFMHRLEKGFDTTIGERGVKLSGGERQRVGIARALIKDPRILIFDEATSSLDSVNEALIHQSVNEASKGRTTIIIAHRFSTIKDVDLVIVFDQGKMVGQGTHEELKQNCTPYRELLRKQILNI